MAWQQWAPYVPVAERRRRAMKKLETLRKKGVDIQPIQIEGRKIAKAIAEIKAGRVEFRVDKNGVIHAPAGRCSFELEQLIDNVGAVLDAINRAKPSASKGTYLKGIYISTTMGPSFRVDPAEVAEAA